MKQSGKVTMQQDEDNNPTVHFKEDYSPLARLVQLGREKKYITLDDILVFFPKPEQNLEQIDRIFAALLAADIAFYDKSDKEK